MPTQQNTALLAKSGKPRATRAKLGRNRLQEARAAVHFWQALEYLAPQSPPKLSADDFVWELDPKSLAGSMPWRDHSKLAILKGKHPQWRFQIFSGIADGRSLIEEARAALGAPPLNLEERRPAGAAACVVLEVNGNGMATGAVFVSTVPWAMAHILEQAGKTTPIDFRGFFGTDGRQEQIQLKVRDLLVERKLLRSAESSAQIPPASPAGAPAIDGPVENNVPARPVVSAGDQAAPAPADELRAIRPTTSKRLTTSFSTCADGAPSSKGAGGSRQSWRRKMATRKRWMIR